MGIFRKGNATYLVSNEIDAPRTDASFGFGIMCISVCELLLRGGSGDRDRLRSQNGLPAGADDIGCRDGGDVSDDRAIGQTKADIVPVLEYQSDGGIGHNMAARMRNPVHITEFFWDSVMSPSMEEEL